MQYKRVIMYSDTCGGQNRNKIIITAILSFLSQSSNIHVIGQKFFESGHSHMECDTMHCAIEFTYSKKEVYIPAEYLMLMKMARKSQDRKSVV